MFGTSTLQISGVCLLLGLATGGWFGYRYADNAAEVAKLRLANKIAGDRLDEALGQIVKEREAAEANARTADWLRQQADTDAAVKIGMQETINELAQQKPADPVCAWPPDVLERLQQLRAKNPR